MNKQPALGGPIGGGTRGGPTPEQAEAARKQAQQQEEQRRIILKQACTPEAYERLANVSLVKPEKARQVESYVINSAQSGQLSGRVTEEQLKDLLVQISNQMQKETKVVISRRRASAFDSDDDDDDEYS